MSEGRYLYENSTKGTLMLSKPAANGIKHLAPGQRFEGDKSFMTMVHSHDLKLIKILQENVSFTPEKVILEQPPTFTQDGKVEMVKKTSNPKKNLSEDKLSEEEAQHDVLLNENPIDGLELI